MITFLTGIVVSVGERTLTMLVNGVGYEVRMGAEALNRVTKDTYTELHTRCTYSENAHTLYGFLTSEDRNLFDLLIAKVDGVGPKSALSIVDMGADNFKQAVREEDKKAITACDGVGSKTADKILLEFKGQFGAATKVLKKPEPPKYSADMQSDLISGLRTMGYSPDAAKQRAKTVIDNAEPGLPIAELLKLALKK